LFHQLTGLLLVWFCCDSQVGNMHGDEPGGRMLLPMLAEWLCSKQTIDQRAARIINGMHLVRKLLFFWGGVDARRCLVKAVCGCRQTVALGCSMLRARIFNGIRMVSFKDSQGLRQKPMGLMANGVLEAAGRGRRKQQLM
jgi:hypothetical protein